LDLMILEVFSNLNNSMILRLYDSVILSHGRRSTCLEQSCHGRSKGAENLPTPRPAALPDLCWDILRHDARRGVPRCAGRSHPQGCGPLTERLWA